MLFLGVWMNQGRGELFSQLFEEWSNVHRVSTTYNQPPPELPTLSMNKQTSKQTNAIHFRMHISLQHSFANFIISFFDCVLNKRTKLKTDKNYNMISTSRLYSFDGKFLCLQFILVKCKLLCVNQTADGSISLSARHTRTAYTFSSLIFWSNSINW